MKKLFSSLIALVLMGMLVIPAWAQDALTQTVVAGTSDFPYSFKYPADWGEPQKSFANTQFDNADGSIHVSISSPFVSAGSTAQAALEKYATNYKNKADIQTFTLDGRDAARLDGPIANRWQILMVIAGGSGSGLITFEGSKAALTNAEPTLLAIAASLHSPPDSDSAAAPTATIAPSDSSAQGTALELTETITPPDGSYTLMSPAGWKWVPTPPVYLLLSGTGDADPVTGQIVNAPKKAGITPESVIQGFGNNSTSAQINGQEVFYVEQSGNGLTAVVGLPDQIALGIFQGSDAAIKKQEATLLAVMASIKSGTAASSAADATPAESGTEAVSAPVVPDLGEGAILAIVDGQVGGSTGMGNELYELNIDTKTGKSLKQFGTTSSSQLNNVTWSPDGSQLAFYSFKSPGVAVVDVNGGNEQLFQQISFVFAWAPDGKHISTTQHNGDDWNISNVALDGSGSQLVLTIKNMKYVDFIRWSPDGKWLAYIGTPADNNDNKDALHIIDATGNNDQLIVPAGDVAHTAMWSANSTQLAYIVKDDLTTFTIDTKETKVIAKQVLAADWSPDGKQFAYVNRNAQLFVANADGTNPKEIAIPADLKGQFVSIAWRPGTTSASTSVEASSPTEASTTTTSTTGAASTCTVSTASGANLRSGPGTSFARAGSLAGGTSQTVTGQAKGSDSFVWWKLESSSWVRSDVVQTSGDCSTVPTATP